MTPKPLFTHDCDLCRFLGTVNAGGRLGDLYVCERNPVERNRSVIFRTGSDGPEYQSVPFSMVQHYPEGHPLRLAASLYMGSGTRPTCGVCNDTGMVGAFIRGEWQEAQYACPQGCETP